MYVLRCVLVGAAYLISVGLFPAVGAAQDGSVVDGVVRGVPTDGGFELPPVVNAPELLPPELLKGPNFVVNTLVATYGFENQYTITSHFGSFSAYGDDMLRIRIQEIRALAALSEMRKGSQFAEAAVKAGKSPFQGVGNLILHPVDTVTGIPKGAWRYMSRVGEMLRGGRGELEDGVAKELIGFSGAKRKLAYNLGVDVYSSNKILQKELNSVSWASYAGGLTVRLGTMAVGAASKIAQLSIRGASMIDQMNKVLRDNSPEDLRKINRQKLAEMNFDGNTIDAFLQHPWYSPSHETFLTEALAGLKQAKGRDAFMRLALTAESEEDAFFFQRIAQLMRGYNDQVSPITEIQVMQGLAVVYAKNQAAVLPVVADLGFWSKQTAAFAEAMQYAIPKDRGLTSQQLWMTGRLSPRAVEELETRKWEIHQQAFAELYPAGQSN